MRYEPKIIPHEIVVKKTLVDFFSEYNHIKIVRTAKRGKILLIDDEVQFAEYDEYIYHEMFCFPALFSHTNPKRILIIGGGDLLLARQLLKHPRIENIDLIELDTFVTKFCVKYFKALVGKVMKDPRINIKNQDGYKFIMDKKEPYDIIYIDLPDKKRNCEFVFEKSFYQGLKRNLTLKGIACAQTGTSDKIYFSLHSRKLREKYKKENSNYFLNYFHLFKNTFKYALQYHEHIPTFFGRWSFTLGSDVTNFKNVNREFLNQNFRLIKENTLYYTPEYHESIFYQPKILQPKESNDN